MRQVAFLICGLLGVGCGTEADVPERTEEEADTVEMRVQLAIMPGQHAAADSFGVISGVALDDSGNLYAVDQRAASVWVFGPEGEPLGRIGSKGEGPGEFDSPTGPGIDPAGRLVVRDVYRVTRFSADPSGVLNSEPETFRGPMYADWMSLRASRFDTAGALYYPSRELTDQAETLPAAIRYSAAGELLDTVQIPQEGMPLRRVPWVRFGPSGGRMLPGLEHVPFAALPVWDVTPEGTILSGAGKDYRIRESGVDGQLLRVYERQLASESIPESERNDSLRALRERLDSIPVQLDEVVGLGEEVRELNLPMTYPAFVAVYTGKEGRVWVRRWIPASHGRSVFDVFDRDGSFRTSVVLPMDVLVEPTPVLSLHRVVAVVRNPLTDVDGVLTFVP